MFQRWSFVVSLLFCIFLGGSSGFWPFDFLGGLQVLGFEDGAPNVKQVAIIGAGAAGASTAYHLQKLANTAGIDINITVFERSSYIGGRSTTVPAWNNLSHPIELGASIFVEVNKILKDATEEFNLKPLPRGDNDDEGGTLGIWNGDKFVFTQKSGGWAWWDITKLIWKYGMAPIRTQRLMRATVGKFLKLYEAPFFPFRSLSDRAVDLELISSTAVTGEQLLATNNIAGAFANDIIQASTRVNYGQNLGLIHGLETMVCMSIEGAMQIEGGNWQIFSRMLNASTATVLLDTSVTSIKNAKGKYTLTSTPANSSATEIKDTEQKFDTVVLAAPLQFAKLDIKDGLVSKLPDEIPYVRLEVTLFASPHKLNPTYFNLKPDEPCPDSILTTLSPGEDPSNRENIVGKSGFFSISTLRRVINPSTGSKEYIYKIFSPKPVDAKFLSNILGIKVAQEVNDLIENPTKDISWFYPKTWHSYPYEFPRVTFEQIELARGFYYTSGIESFISTMETSALMGMNVAQLIMDDYLELLGGMPNKEGQDQKVVEDL